MKIQISNLIRAQYATNTIDAIIANPLFSNLDPAEFAREYFDVELTHVNAKGDTVSCCGKYAMKVFTDVKTHTEFDLTGPTFANTRKQLLGAINRYTAVSGKEYMPSCDYQNMIVKYLKADSWQQLCNDCESLLEEAESFLRDVASGQCQPSLKNIVLSPKELRIKSELTIRFSTSAIIKLQALGNHEFLVVSEHNTNLQKGDVISITDRIIIGNRMCAEIVSSTQKRFNKTWLSPNVRSFKNNQNQVMYVA